MWVALAIASAFCLGFYDIFKKLSVRSNNVLLVLLWSTSLGAVLMLPVLVAGIADGNFGFDNTLRGHALILVKSFIVLGSWLLGFTAMKYLPLTIQGPINASRPVLVGAVLIFGERLNALQWTGILLGFLSLFLISRIGMKSGLSLRHSRWLWMAIGAMVLGAVSGLYDKYLLRLYRPLEVQAWYSLYQCVIMTMVIFIIRRRQGENGGTFSWRWTIPCISIFLTVADVAYFYALSCDGSMISTISMIRRGSVIVSFVFGATILHEKNIRAKAIDLAILLVSLILLVIGSQQA